MIFEDGAGFLNEILARKLFVELVGGGDWDLSNYLKFSGRCPSAKCKKTVTLCGRCYDGSVATNLFYAYVGRVCGFSEAELNIGGHVAELFAHLQGDTEQDKASIQVGFCIFNQTGVDGVVTRQILCGCVSQKGDAALASNLPREGIQNCKPGSHVWTTNKELPE